MVRLTDRPDMTLDVYRGCKTTIQQQQQPYSLKINGGNKSFIFILASHLITLKEIISKTDECLVILSSKTYVFEDKLTKY